VPGGRRKLASFQAVARQRARCKNGGNRRNQRTSPPPSGGRARRLQHHRRAARGCSAEGVGARGSRRVRHSGTYGAVRDPSRWRIPTYREPTIPGVNGMVTCRRMPLHATPARDRAATSGETQELDCSDYPLSGVVRQLKTPAGPRFHVGAPGAIAWRQRGPLKAPARVSFEAWNAAPALPGNRVSAVRIRPGDGRPATPGSSAPGPAPVRPPPDRRSKPMCGLWFRRLRDRHRVTPAGPRKPVGSPNRFRTGTSLRHTQAQVGQPHPSKP